MKTIKLTVFADSKRSSSFVEEYRTRRLRYVVSEKIIMVMCPVEEFCSMHVHVPAVKFPISKSIAKSFTIEVPEDMTLYAF